MGELVSGKWVEKQPVSTNAADGRFVRASAKFRGAIGDAAHPAAAGRYHLYVSYACPWAHRTLIMRKLKGLDDLVAVSSVRALMLENGWEFDVQHPDALYGQRFLYELYQRADSDVSGKVTVPVLWDAHAQRIVNNESSEIVRIFNSAFDGLGARPGDYYPEALRAEIDAVNERVYDTVNNGVYKAGFAGSQAAYDDAVSALFATLDWLEQRLTHDAFLVGNRLTEADIRLFTTLVRFDAVYYVHFKCNVRRIADYPALRAYRRRIYELPGVAETVDIDTIKQHYFGSHRWINPTGIVPRGPKDFL